MRRGNCFMVYRKEKGTLKSRSYCKEEKVKSQAVEAGGSGANLPKAFFQKFW
jgi:hypothetical protein